MHRSWCADRAWLPPLLRSRSQSSCLDPSGCLRMSAARFNPAQRSVPLPAAELSVGTHHDLPTATMLDKVVNGSEVAYMCVSSAEHSLCRPCTTHLTRTRLWRIPPGRTATTSSSAGLPCTDCTCYAPWHLCTWALDVWSPGLGGKTCTPGLARPTYH